MYLKIKEYKKFAYFNYHTNPKLEYLLGTILKKESNDGVEIGVILQVHGEDEYRTDMWGNCCRSEVSFADILDVAKYRPELMEEIEETEVIFRKFKDGGEIIAVFPYDITPNFDIVGSYLHIGQHGECAYRYIISETVPAELKEYKELYVELQNHFNYRLKVVRKQNRKRYVDLFWEKYYS